MVDRIDIVSANKFSRCFTIQCHLAHARRSATSGLPSSFVSGLMRLNLSLPLHGSGIEDFFAAELWFPGRETSHGARHVILSMMRKPI